MTRRAALAVLGLAAVARGAPVSEVTRTEAASSRASYLQLGVGARAAGMGEAVTAVADDASAAAWNPAGLGRLVGPSAAAGYDPLGAGLSLGHLAVASPFGRFVAGGGVSVLSAGTYEVRDADGTEMGIQALTEVTAAVSGAAEHPANWPSGWSGLSVELASESAGGLSLGFSAGTLVRIGERVVVGASARHLGPARNGHGLPGVVAVGGAVRASLQFECSADAEIGLTDHVATVSVGFEYRPWTPIALRAGYRRAPAAVLPTGTSGAAAGMGFRIGRIGLDYAYQPFGKLATSHRLSVVWTGLARSPATPHAAPPPRSGIPTAALAPTADEMYSQASAPSTTDSTVSAPASVPGPGSTPAPVPEVVAPVALPPVPAPQVPPAALFASAKIKYGAKDYRGAWKDAADILKQDSRDARAWQLLGNCQYKLGDTAGALKSFGYALQLNPDNPALKAWVDSLNAPK